MTRGASGPNVTGPEIEAVLDELASSMPGVNRSTEGPARGTAWTVVDQTFAILEDDAVELRLDPAIAAAAARTPDASPSDRGPEWVRFEPSTLEGHDLDRLEAWFGLAHRRAVATVPRT
jgi:hypothetical protein